MKNQLFLTMLNQISQHLKARIQQFPASDKILFNNKLIEINPQYFESIPEIDRVHRRRPGGNPCCRKFLSQLHKSWRFSLQRS